jgi:hypothetical protein
MTQQILYVAIGPRYLTMALRSAASAQAAGFTGGVTIVTDQPAPNPAPAGIIFAAVATPAAPPFGPLEYKTRFLDFAIDPQGGCPDQVLFLDADTLVKGDVTPIFQARGIALVPEIYPTPAQSPFSQSGDFAVTQAAGLDQVPFWNSGLVAIGNDAAGKALCAAWHAEWAKFPNDWDELAMLRALKSTSTTPTALEPKWNDQGYPPKTGLIRHYVGGQKLAEECLNG